MNQTVIACYSRTGAAALAARHLQALTGWPCLEVSDPRQGTGWSATLSRWLQSVFHSTPHCVIRGADMESCSHLVLVAPVWWGCLAAPVRSLLHLLFRPGWPTGIENVSMVCVTGARSAGFSAAAEVTRIVGRTPRLVLALTEAEVMNGSGLARLSALQAVAPDQAAGETASGGSGRAALRLA